jgi:MFS family permease
MTDKRPALTDPLKESPFGSIWFASLLSNLGQLMLGVGAAWEMLRMTGAVNMVALVHTSMMLPMMLIAIPAGAIADIYDRRKIALAGLGFALLNSAILAVLAYAGYLTPWSLLACCMLIGSGLALYGPAWQSSISEQVSQRNLPAAIALGSISYNLARSVGPAVGGAVVAVFGAVSVFGLNALFLLPIIYTYWRWQRKTAPSRLPAERLGRATISGLRYVAHAPAIRTVALRTFISCFAAASFYALMPLVAAEKLGGDANIYGLLLGAIGVGAVIGASLISRARQLPPERAVVICSVLSGVTIAAMGYSPYIWLTCLILLITGAAWMLLIASFNVAVQLSAPRWVTARALSCFQAAITGGMAVGAWAWGEVAARHGLELALAASGGVLLLSVLLGMVMPMPNVHPDAATQVCQTTEPDVNLDIRPRSGPVVIEILYRIHRDQARDFYHAVQDVRRGRLRNGGYNWSIARDIADLEIWIERFICPTWADYLHQRDRATNLEREAVERINLLQMDGTAPIVRRHLERPFGSVRWWADTPDHGDDAVRVYHP